MKLHKAGVWVHCPGSVSMQDRYPSEPGEAAREGTEAARIAEVVFKTGVWEPCNDEMRQAVEMYVSALAGQELHVEYKVQCPRIHPTCSGIPDCWYVQPGEIHVWDFKYGHGVVEAFENWQMICYTAGIMDLLKGKEMLGLADQRWTAVMHICQPRAYHVLGPVREWRVPLPDLRAHINLLNAAAHQALEPDPRTVSGSWCRYCSGRHACCAAARAGQYSVEYVDNAVPQELSPEAMAIEIRTLRRAAEAIGYRLSGHEAQAAAMGGIPGFSVTRGAGKLDWASPLSEVFTLGDGFGVDLRKSPDAITPTQAKKLIPAEVLALYTRRLPGSVKLIEDGKTLAGLVFGKRE